MILDIETCPDGQYYCFDDKKCKPIPKGKKVGKNGMLETTELKNEILSRAQKKHTMAKGKKLKDVMAKGKEAKEKLYKTTRDKGVRFYDKKGSGYMKDGKKKYD
tara:strand:- start:62 stop:373 length:312 start_codon:yes stop_codon:yes gene_type:complete